MNDSTLSQDVYRLIKQQIVTCQLLPGMPLQEQELSESLEVSRTPVREALRLLAKEGLVELRAHRGARVAQLSRQDLMDAYEVRGWVEPLAAAKVAATVDGATLERLEATVNRIPEDPVTHEEANLALQADLEFHRLIVEATGNRLLIQILEDARAITERAAFFVPPGRYHQSKEEHRAVLEAFRKRDSQAAERAMRAHIEAASSRMLLLSNHRFPLGSPIQGALAGSSPADQVGSLNE